MSHFLSAMCIFYHCHSQVIIKHITYTTYKQTSTHYARRSVSSQVFMLSDSWTVYRQYVNTYEEVPLEQTEGHLKLVSLTL